MSPRAFSHWSELVRECESRGHPYVIATLLGARGSTPRDSGTKMVVSADACTGTLGGGQLEYAVQQRARALIAAGRDAQRVDNFPLGARLGQCCGGSTSVLLECFQPQRLPVYLFGAGHVGRALAPLLAAKGTVEIVDLGVCPRVGGKVLLSFVGQAEPAGGEPLKIG